MTEGQGWHNEPYEHDLARQGVSTKSKRKAPLVTEEQAQEMVANMQGKSTSHISQERSQMSWYEEHWLEGKSLPEEKLDELDIQDLQQIRTEVEKHLEKITNAYEHREFYAQERDRIKSKIGTKLQQQMKELEKDLELLNQ